MIYIVKSEFSTFSTILQSTSLKKFSTYLWKLLKARRQPFIYRVTKYANHAIELARELVEEKGCTQILVLGGDGTLSEVINGIMRANLTPEQRAGIQFGVMPRGTGNDFARHWGLNKDFKRLYYRGESIVTRSVVIYVQKIIYI